MELEVAVKVRDFAVNVEPVDNTSDPFLIPRVIVEPAAFSEAESV